MDNFLLLTGFFTKGVLLSLATLIPIMNPLAMAPTFLMLTEGVNGPTRTALARRVGINVMLLLTGATLIGSYILDFFGISLPIVRIGGGLIVVSAAWKMLNQKPSTPNNRQQMAESFTPAQVRERAFYPMTFPLTCGPGSIAASLTVGAALFSPDWPVRLAGTAGSIVANCIMGVAVFATYRYARQLMRPLGDTGMVVFLRLSAFILLCVGVQIVWTGASELIRELAAIITADARTTAAAATDAAQMEQAMREAIEAQRSPITNPDIRN